MPIDRVLHHVVDTNVCIHYMRGHETAVKWLVENRRHSAITDVVRLELFRRANKPSSRRTIENFVASMHVLLTERAHIARAKTCYRDWERSRGPNPDLPDMMIAQVALSHGLSIVTENLKDFEHIPGIDLVAMDFS